jgi:hypothetical protein
MAITPPGYCSGVVLTLREPHLEHFMRLPTSGTGVSPGKRNGGRVHVALVAAVAAVHPQQLIGFGEVT